MAAVQGSYKNLLQGVSRQPIEQRKDGQCERQVNMSADPVGNLKKRAPLQYVGEITGGTNPYQNFFFDYDREGEATYLFEVTKAGEVFASDTDGNSYEVLNLAKAYLVSDEPVKNLATTTIQDITVIANKQRTVKMTGSVQVGYEDAPEPKHSGGVARFGDFPELDLAYFEITSSTWATGFEISLRDKASGKLLKLEYLTPDGIKDPEKDAPKIKPAYVAAKLIESSGLTLGYATKSLDRYADQEIWTKAGPLMAAYDNLLVVNANRFEVLNVDDGNGGKFIRYCNNTISTIEELPSKAVNGELVKIKPDNQTESGIYYLRFIAETDHFGKGEWVECAEEGIQTTFNKLTLPVLMVRLQKTDGTPYFYVSPADGSQAVNLSGFYEVPNWYDRKVGDEDSNPTPSFVNYTIQNIGVYQNRLFFLSRDNVIFSTGDTYWDFWYRSATDVIDTDPVDLSAGVGNTGTLLQTVQQSGDLILFSSTQQFIIFGDKALKPSTAFIAPATTFNSSLTATPIAAGRNVYFATQFGEFAGLREFQTDALSATRDAPPVTAHVSNFIQGTVRKFASSNTAGQLFLVTDSFDSKLYCYEYLWSGNELVQSAWSYWELDIGLVVLYAFTLNTTLFTVVYNTATGKTYLNKTDLEDAVFTNFGFNIYLDMLVELTVDENNQVTLPYDFSTIHFVQGNNCPNSGLLAGKSIKAQYTDTPLTFTFRENLVGGTVYAGIPYLAQYTPTDPVVRDSRGIPMSQGELRLNRYLLTYRDSGYIQGTLDSRYLESVTGTLSGRVVGDFRNIVGKSPLLEGTVSMPVMQSPQNCTVTFHSDDYKPMKLVTLEWEGSFSQGKRRL